MRSCRNALFGLVLPAALLMLPGAIAAPAVGGEFELTGSIIPAGAGTAAGAGFELAGSVAQATADPVPASGGEFVLAGGFWTGANNDGLLFSNGFEGG